MTAIELLRQLNERSPGKSIPEGASVDFVPPTWREYVIAHDKAVRRYYELCVEKLLQDVGAGTITIASEAAQQYLLHKIHSGRAAMGRQATVAGSLQSSFLQSFHVTGVCAAVFLTAGDSDPCWPSLQQACNIWHKHF